MEKINLTAVKTENSLEALYLRSLPLIRPKPEKIEEPDQCISCITLVNVTQRYGCECDNRNISDPRFQRLANVLPLSYVVRICSYVEEGDGFIAKLRLQLKTADEAKEWLKLFQFVSKTTMRVGIKYADNERLNVYKVEMRCQHKTRTPAKKQSSKNTGCKAKIRLTIRRTDLKRSRAKDGHMPDFPMIVQLQYIHNHPINSPEFLRFRDVSESTKQQFVELFKAGYPPKTALKMYKYDLQVKGPEDLEQINGDRAVIPDITWCYRLYYATVGKSGDGQRVRKERKKKSTTVVQKKSPRKETQEVSDTDSEDDQNQSTYDIIREYKEYQSQLIMEIESNPELYVPALRCSLKNARKLNTSVEKSFALRSYGKYLGEPQEPKTTIVTKRKKSGKGAVKRNSVITVKPAMLPKEGYISLDKTECIIKTDTSHEKHTTQAVRPLDATIISFEFDYITDQNQTM